LWLSNHIRIFEGSVIGVSTITVFTKQKTTKDKTNRMKKDFYEMTYILNPVLDEDKFSELVGYVNKLIEDNGGEVVETDEWGVRKLAYDIDKKSTGYYVNLYFNAPAETIAPVERNMRIHDDIMRYLTLKYDAKMKRYYELRKKGDLPVVFEELEENQENEDED
jgi:small subunit ribosomal protein S6